MNRKTYNLISGVVFAVVTILHVVRLYYGWTAVINGVIIPAWPSYVFIGVGGSLAFFGFKLSK